MIEILGEKEIEINGIKIIVELTKRPKHGRDWMKVYARFKEIYYPTIYRRWDCIHWNCGGTYGCNQKVSAHKDKLTDEREKVTCKNCLYKLEYPRE